MFKLLVLAILTLENEKVLSSQPSIKPFIAKVRCLIAVKQNSTFVSNFDSNSDIVIGCEGSGDPSGIGLFKKEEFPDVGIRPFAPLVNLNCGDRPINTKALKGSPGSMFIVRCPEDCSEDPTDVRGTFIYSDDSSACRAALHIGAIDDSGGDFVIVLGYGQRSYMGSTRGHIKSSELGPYARSFMVSLLIPSVKARVASEFKRNIYVHFSGESLLQKLSPFSFLQDAAASSGASTPALTVEPIFSWCPPPGFSGFHQRPGDFVDASKLPGGTALTQSSDFSISARLRVTGRQGTWRAILAHTECNGLTLAVNKNDELVFEQVCNTKSVMTGYKPKMGDWVHCVVTYYQPDQTVSIFVNGRRMVYEKTNFVFSFASALTIGRSSYIDTEFFEGDIGCIRIFNFVLNPTQISTERNLIEKPSRSCPPGVIQANSAFKTRYTVDGRLCLTPCVPQSAAEVVPATPARSPAAPHAHVTHPAFSIGCNTTLEDPRFDGATGDCFRVICPPGCCASTSPIYGNEFYAAKSSICRAALHKGVMGDPGAEIGVTLQNGLTFYENSVGHNYVESLLEDTPQSRSFTVSRARRLPTLTCFSDASFIMKMPLATRHLVQCPEGCRTESKGQVYGTGVYSPASAVCRAALHAGVLTDNGGQVELEVSGEGQFAASHQNGVESQASDYYLRSFTFLRTTQVSCVPYSLQELAFSKGLPHSRRSAWKQYPQRPFATESFEIVSTPSTGGVVPEKTAIVINDVHMDPSGQPLLFVLNHFNCDRFSLYATFLFEGLPSSAGVCFGIKDGGNEFFTLTAAVNEPSGMGEWTLTKHVNGESISAGKPVPFRFSLNTPIHVHLENVGHEVQGWTLVSETEKQMVAHVKDLLSTPSTQEQRASVGIHVFEAPEHKNVKFTDFQILVSPPETQDMSPEWRFFRASTSTPFSFSSLNQDFRPIVATQTAISS